MNAMQSHDDPIGYSAMIHDALRSVVRKTLLQVKGFGMPKDHHFYITFKTMAPQVVLPLYLRQKYPESMTIVLQYQFYNLTITDSLFSVSLSFGGKFETLTVPFSAIVMFSDPEAQLVFNFEPESETLPPVEQPSAKPSAVADKDLAEKLLPSTGKKPAATSKSLDKNLEQNPDESHGSISAKTMTTKPTKNPAWRGSVAFGAQTPFEPPQQETKTQSQSQHRAQNKAQAKQHNKDRLKSVSTQTSAKVLTFRPKKANAPHDDKNSSKTP